MADTSPLARRPPPAPADAPLAAYLLAEPFVAGKVVLDIGPRPPRSSERLARAGARDVLNGDGPGPELDLRDASVDVVLCVSRLSAVTTTLDRHRWLSELRRVLRPGGFCLVRLPVSSLETDDQSASSALHELLRHHFPLFDVVAEAPLAGVAYQAPDTDEAAVNEELAPIASTPTHLLALCAAEPPRPWTLPESLLVPLRLPGAALVEAASEDLAALRQELEALRARHDEASRDRDSLRETAMTLQDRLDHQDEALSTLRRQTERHLHQLSQTSAALELATLERDRLQRLLTSAESALERQADQRR